MAGEIGGWSVTASKTNAPAVAEKAGVAQRQHVIYGISASFSAAPAGPVLLQIIDPDLSPNTVLWEDYVSTPIDRTFPAGICALIGHGIEVVLGAGGSAVVGKANIHGNTR